MNELRTAVLIPCFNEASSIGRVLDSFREHLPFADLYVYDNGSSDQTAAIARSRGALVKTVRARGKGHVVREMFKTIDADIYILIDGDGTYDASQSPLMLQRFLEQQLDVLNGARVVVEEGAFRLGRKFGNRFFTGLLRVLFQCPFRDVLSGYKIFSRRFVKTVSLQSSGFEIETELVVYALNVGASLGEVPIRYFPRAEGSRSKLNPFTDGIKVLGTVLKLGMRERPSLIFGSFALSSLLAILFLVQSGFREEWILMMVASALLSVIVGLSGLVLERIHRAHWEIRKLSYRSLPLPPYASRRRMKTSVSGAETFP